MSLLNQTHENSIRMMNIPKPISYTDELIDQYSSVAVNFDELIESYAKIPFEYYWDPKEAQKYKDSVLARLKEIQAEIDFIYEGMIRERYFDIPGEQR